MIDIPPGWLALIGSLGASLATGIGIFLRYKQKEITDRDAIIAKLQAQLDAMRDQRLQALQDQLNKRG